jgi:hypothetical protein
MIIMIIDHQLLVIGTLFKSIIANTEDLRDKLGYPVSNATRPIVISTAISDARVILSQLSRTNKLIYHVSFSVQGVRKIFEQQARKKKVGKMRAAHDVAQH